MGFGLWHWVIVGAIFAFAFWRQLPSLILYLNDPSRAFKHRLGMLNAKDREAMLRRQEAIRLQLKQRGWFVLVATLVLIVAWKALSYWTGRTQP